MKVIGFEEIKNLNIAPGKFYEWVSQAIECKGETVLPPKISMKLPIHRFCNVMPCVLPYLGTMGVKIVTRFPDNQAVKPSLNSHILLYDAETGEMTALMDGTYITALRTGAVAAHAVKLLARSDFSTVGLMGLGIMGRAAFLVIADIFKNKEFLVKLFRYKNQAEAFVERFSSYKNITFQICDNREDVLANSDVLLSCVTYTENDFADPSIYKPGCTIVPVHTRGFMECDLVFDKVFADDKGHVQGFKYFDRFRQFAEVSDVVKNRAPGRQSDAERILVYNIGLAIHDICIASHICELFSDSEILQISEAPGKYWL